jgi:hypothetical protein
MAPGGHLMEPVSEQRLAPLHPYMIAMARAIDAKCQALNGHALRVTQGMRTWAQQDALYAEGRSVAGKVVTNARGGYSMHNFGLAVDLCPEAIAGGVWEPDWNETDPLYKAMVAAGAELGLNCGANWHSLIRLPTLSAPKGAEHAHGGDAIGLRGDVASGVLRARRHGRLPQVAPGENMNFKAWVRTILSAAISAAATGFTTAVVSPETFNFSHAGLVKLGQVCGITAFSRLPPSSNSHPCHPPTSQTRQGSSQFCCSAARWSWDLRDATVRKQSPI